jgi:hypothetical protein
MNTEIRVSDAQLDQATMEAASPPPAALSRGSIVRRDVQEQPSALSAWVDTQLDQAAMEAASPPPAALSRGSIVRRDVQEQPSALSIGDPSSFLGAPTFFQMGSVEESEEVADTVNQRIGSSNAHEDSTSKSDLATDAGSPPMQTPLTDTSGKRKLSSIVQKPQEAGHSSEEDGGGSIRVKDLSDRTIRTPFMAPQNPSDGKQNAVANWFKDLIAVGEHGADSTSLNAADTLGESDAEANYDLETEGVWLLRCMAGLLFFSFLMICISRGCPSNRCMAPRHDLDKPTIHTTAEGPSKQALNPSADEAGHSLVPAFESVVNSARAAEEVSLEKAAVGGVEELLSAVTGRPSETVVLRAPNPEVMVISDGTPSVSDSNLKEGIKAVPALTEKLLCQLEASETGYDCVLAKPLSFSQVLRMQATVLQPANSDMLAPLAMQMCVLYQVTVTRRLHAGMPSVPVAFSSMSSAFRIAPCTRTDLRIAVDGSDVMMFDTVVGSFSYKGPFGAAPGHLQDYVLTHRSAVPGGRWQTSSALRTDSTPLEFQECALLVGSRVTVVGELARDACGELMLRPAVLGLPELSESPRVLVSDNYEELTD